MTKIKNHNKCEIDIRWKVVYGNSHPAPALFCTEHNAWLKWISREDAFKLISEGIPVKKYKKDEK